MRKTSTSPGTRPNIFLFTDYNIEFVLFYFIFLKNNYIVAIMNLIINTLLKKYTVKSSTLTEWETEIKNTTQRVKRYH